VINPPLSLYLHLPWCVRKCPYCDFNAHEIKNGAFPEKEYIDALIRDLHQSAERIEDREIVSIFFGGGTPSVISAQGINRVLEAVDSKLILSNETEITLEANPGAVDCQRFADYKRSGIIEAADSVGFSNINIDLMYGLPQQTPEDALGDLEQAIQCEPGHISWYQLTIEPNTVFYSKPPALPDSETSWQIQTQGQRYLSEHQYVQYEISAYSREELVCKHNLNYWTFGDYLGIGAGAHGKITDNNKSTITRQSKLRVPASYISHAGTENVYTEQKQLSNTDLILEFMLNVLRLKNGVPRNYFAERTGLKFENIHEQITAVTEKGLLEDDQSVIRVTEKGARYLNDLLQYFMLE